MSQELTQLGPYAIIERIGSGGMATVYRAQMRTNDGVTKVVALKVLHPHLAAENSFVKMFLKECELAVELRHENIVSPFDFGVIDGTYYMAMDYYRGLNLRTILETLRKQNLNLSTASGIYILTEVLLGLRYAHRFTDREQRVLEIIHRDISPQNILVTTDGDIRLIDFGIAKIMGETGLTEIGTIKGKLQYMSPEQAAGKKLDRRTDIYSLGVVSHEVFTGDMLFPDREPTRLLRQIQVGDFRFADDFDLLPTRLQRVIRKALNRNVNKRYEEAKSFRDELIGVARRDLQAFNPTQTRRELGMLIRSLRESVEQGVEEIEVPSQLMEAEIEEAVSDSVRPRESDPERDMVWPKMFVYGCAVLLVLALLLEVVGIDIRPEQTRSQDEITATVGEVAPATRLPRRK